MPSTTQGYERTVKRMAARNVGATAIPAFGLVRVTESSKAGAGMLSVDQPNADSMDVMVNGPFPILPGSYGSVSRDMPLFALYHAADGAPANGETWGSGSGSYELRKNKTGFAILGGAVSFARGGVTYTRVQVGPQQPLYSVGGLTVTDTIHTVASTTSITTAIANGLQVGGSAGAATLTLLVASTIQQGVVTTAAQTFAGPKGFSSGAIVSGDVTGGKVGFQVTDLVTSPNLVLVAASTYTIASGPDTGLVSGQVVVANVGEVPALTVGPVFEPTGAIAIWRTGTAGPPPATPGYVGNVRFLEDHFYAYAQLGRLVFGGYDVSGNYQELFSVATDYYSATGIFDIPAAIRFQNHSVAYLEGLNIDSSGITVSAGGIGLGTGQTGTLGPGAQCVYGIITNKGSGSYGTGSVTSIATTSPILGGTITGAGTISHATSGVTAATYGDATHVAQVALNATGHVTSAVAVAITYPEVAGTILGDNYVATAETTTATSAADLSTADTATFAAPASGNVWVQYHAITQATVATGALIQLFSEVMLDGSLQANSISECDPAAINKAFSQSILFQITGLSAGSHTIKVQHYVGGISVTGKWQNRGLVITAAP